MRSTLALALALVACGSDPAPPTSAAPTPVTAPTPPLAPVRRLPVRVVAWRVTGTGSGLVGAAAQTLAAGDCPFHEGTARDVRLHGRVGDDGVLEWMADDAAESMLQTCLWDPFFRPARLGPGDFELRVSLTDAAAPLPEASDAASPIDWSGLTCRHRVAAHCPPDHTCPESVWNEEACPAP